LPASVAISGASITPPEAQDGGRADISRADFTWCLIAIDWGWSVEDTAAQLMEESSKALENGQHYALRTV
jgi:hypothetical protein